MTDTSANTPGAITSVLVIGASGSIGRLVVTESVRTGCATTVLVRDPEQAAMFPKGTRVVVGDPSRAENLEDALTGVNGIVFTQGTYSSEDAELANYAPVRAVLDTLRRPARIALMTALGVTKPSVGHDWKRRSERLVRASGLPYTIVRPGWFDRHEPDEHALVLLQGDRRWAGDPSDGVISRRQIAEVLVASLTVPAARGKTFELVATMGEAQADLDPVLAELQPDAVAALDGPLDRDTLPLADEPQSVLAELEAVRGLSARVARS